MRFTLASLSLVIVLLTGCALSPTATPTPANGAAIQGMVHGGQQPIAGASVYLYAAGTGGYGTASTSLLTSSVLTNSPGSSGKDGSGNYYVVTDAGGNFNISSDYACTTGQQVYLYVTGGNSGGGSNSAIGLLAILGNCPAGGSFASTVPFVSINEVTTIAAAYAFAGFATDAVHVSYGNTLLGETGIQNAFANAANLASIATGAALTTTPAGNATVPQSTINSLANILSSCVNSAGTFTTCSTLFSNAESAGSSGTTPTDTAIAAINIAHNPGANIANLCGLQLPTAPFSPDLPCENSNTGFSDATTYPSDFTLDLNFTGGGIDDPDGIAIDGSGNAWVGNALGKTVTEISSSGPFLSGTGGYTGGGINGAYGIAIDLNGDAWVANQNGSSVTEISSSGSFLSGAGGYTANSTLDFPRGIAVDGSNNVWIANYLNSTVTVLSNAGVVLSGPTGYTGGSQDFIYYPNAIAIGPDGSAWVANQDGNNVTRLNLSGQVLSGQYGYTASIDDPYGIAIDGSGNGWVASIAPNDGNIAQISNTGTFLSGSSGYTGGGVYRPYAVAIDGANNAWIANNYGDSVSEISSSGAYLSGTTGYSGTNGAANSNGPMIRPYAIAIDGSGDVWIADYSGASVTELIGVATPVVTPLAAGVKNGTLGSRP